MLRHSWPGQEFFVATKCFYVTTECHQMERFLFQHSNSMSRHSCPGYEGFLLQPNICVAKKLAKARRKYVAIEQFYVTIEMARVGRNFVATELVTIEEFYRPRQSWACTTGCVRDKEILSPQRVLGHDRLRRSLRIPCRDLTF